MIGVILVLGLRTVEASDHDRTATVDHATSGHTLELLFELNLDPPATHLRLAAIQAPDLHQSPWGKQAHKCLTQLLPNRRERLVRVEANDWTADRYGRLWAYVWHGNTLVNQAVLEQGCAYLAGDPMTHGKHASTLLHAQELARLLGRGIWNPENPLRETAEAFRERPPSP